MPGELNTIFLRARLFVSEFRWNSGLMVPMVLAVLVMGSAVATVLVKHDIRMLTARIDTARAEREKIRVEWSQLQLEEAALSYHARVERLAREELGMAEPERHVIVSAPAMGRGH